MTCRARMLVKLVTRADSSMLPRWGLVYVSSFRLHCLTLRCDSSRLCAGGLTIQPPVIGIDLSSRMRHARFPNISAMSDLDRRVCTGIACLKCILLADSWATFSSAPPKSLRVRIKLVRTESLEGSTELALSVYLYSGSGRPVLE